jgi:hypothetical protein
MTKTTKRYLTTFPNIFGDHPNGNRYSYKKPNKFRIEVIKPGKVFKVPRLFFKWKGRKNSTGIMTDTESA